MGKLFNATKFVKKLILDAVFPKKCVDCSKNGFYICPHCAHSLATTPLITEAGVYTLFDYKNTIVRKLLWYLKYKGAKEIGAYFGKELAAEFLEEISELVLFSGKREIVVTPVPLHPSKHKKRGFNQSEIIAEHFASSLGLSLDLNLVHKKVDTEPQVLMKNKEDRKNNLRFAFVANVLAKDKIILLVDDITTTGTTLLEMKKALHKCGAHRIIMFAIAKA